MTCASCKFWKSHGDRVLTGDCRRHAPAVIDRSWDHPEYGRQLETAAEFPHTSSTDWCGDFQSDTGIDKLNGMTIGEDKNAEGKTTC